MLSLSSKWRILVLSVGFIASPCGNAQRNGDLAAPRPGAPTVMGCLGSGAVFVRYLDARSVLLGKWIEMREFAGSESGPEQYRPRGPVSKRQFSENQLIVLTEGRREVVPIVYESGKYCKYPNDSRKRCFTVARYNNETALAEVEFPIQTAASEIEKALGRGSCAFQLRGILSILENPPPEAAPTTGATVTGAGSGNAIFHTEGLQYANLLNYIRDGRFDRIAKGDRTAVNLLFLRHVDNFGAACDRELPAEICGTTGGTRCKVPLTKEVCLDRKLKVTHSTNPYIPSESHWECTKSELRPTGYYADPRFERLLKPISVLLGLDLWSQMPGRSGSLADMANASLSTAADMQMLFKLNSCKSPALKEFSENLLRLVQDDPSLQANQGAPTFWEQRCSKGLPSILPGARPDACRCLEPVLRSNVDKAEMLRLEDDFSADRFLFLSVSKVGLREKVAACLR